MGITLKTVISDTATGRMLRMMEVARNVSGKSTEEIVTKQTSELSKNLAKRCGEIAKPVAYYDALPATLNYRIRRPSDSQREGVSASGKARGSNSASLAKEIRARKQSRKYLASCWLRVRNVRGRLQPVKKVRGEILIKWPSGPFQKGEVILINKARNKRQGEMIASQVHRKFGIVAKAMNDTTRNMIPYIRRKRGEAIKRVRDTK